MQTELDRQIDAGIAGLTAPGSMMPLATVTHHGAQVPAIAAAPPSLPHYFAHFVGQHRDATFLVSGEERLTFGEVHAAAHAVAASLVDGYGIARGAHVGIAMKNSPTWIVLYMGVLMAGGCATLLNGWWQGDELADAIGDAEVALIFADPPRVARLNEIRHGAELVELDDRLPLGEAIRPLLARGGGEDTALPEMAGDDKATILFTSGSTGRSKGALSDHRAVVQATFGYLAQTLTMLGILSGRGEAPTVQPCTLLNIPLFHVTAEVPVFLQSFAMGRKLVLMPKWNAEEAMRLIAAEQATYFVGVPLMSFEMLTHPRRDEYDLSSLRDIAAGGAARPAEHVRRIVDEMGGGAPVLGYGLTETNAIGCGNVRENYVAKPASTGRAMAPLIELTIKDDGGATLPQGEEGEVTIRSVCTIREYWNRPEDSARAFTADGFFRTGDLGYLDAEGYLFIVDRKKDIIIRGGENIAALEVEEAIYNHPGVAEVAVFGIADARFGEVPAAVVHWREGAALAQPALQAWLGERIAAFKVPARIWSMPDALPRLGTEKIDKVTLRSEYRARAAAETAQAAQTA